MKKSIETHYIELHQANLNIRYQDNFAAYLKLSNLI